MARLPLDVDAFDRLAALLDAEPVTLDDIAADHPGWICWEHGGRYYARRNDGAGRFTETNTSPRRFAVGASTPGRLAVMVLFQESLDADAENGHQAATDGP